MFSYYVLPVWSWAEDGSYSHSRNSRFSYFCLSFVLEVKKKRLLLDSNWIDTETSFFVLGHARSEVPLPLLSGNTHTY